MNNNRNNNNRRRGRGNNRNSGGGNPMSQNRIDSRARGNAPQLLDKYKKLAHDAAMNDDRVQTEYYLQFADHYFRVVADNQAQKEEQRAKRDAERGNDRNSDSDDDDDQDNRRKPRKSARDGNSDDGGKPRGRKPRKQDDDDDFRQGSEGEDADGNPFSPDGEKPKAQSKTGRTRKPKAEANGIESVLPPAIGNDDDDAPAQKSAKPRRTRRPKADDSDGAAEAVG